MRSACAYVIEGRLRGRAAIRGKGCELARSLVAFEGALPLDFPEKADSMLSFVNIALH